MKYTLITIVGISIIGMIFYLYFFVFARQPDKKISVTQSLELSVPDGMRPYKSLIFRFFLFYPDDLRVKEYGGGSDTTITFENIKTGKGFQIFVIPYKEDYITSSQLKKDLPSEIIKDSVDVLINGTRATMFYSQDAIMGETREVWFVKNGFLYEVTAHKSLDAWLSNIMRTWRFL